MLLFVARILMSKKKKKKHLAINMSILHFHKYWKQNGGFGRAWAYFWLSAWHACFLMFSVFFFFFSRFNQLAYCVVQFLEKDAVLTEPVSSSYCLGKQNVRFRSQKKKKKEQFDAINSFSTVILVLRFANPRTSGLSRHVACHNK